MNQLTLVAKSKGSITVRKRNYRSLAIIGLISMVAGVLLTSGCVGNSAVPQSAEVTNWGIKNVTPKEASSLIQANKNNPNFVIVDVRPSRYYERGYIEGAVHISLDIINPSVFQNKLNSLDKSKTYLTYCPDGCGAAARIMNDLGFNKIYDISGGYNSWVQKGLPIVE